MLMYFIFLSRNSFVMLLHEELLRLESWLVIAYIRVQKGPSEIEGRTENKFGILISNVLRGAIEEIGLRRSIQRYT